MYFWCNALSFKKRFFKLAKRLSASPRLSQGRITFGLHGNGRMQCLPSRLTDCFISLKTILSSLEEGTSNADVALPKSVSQRLSIWRCTVSFVTPTKFVEKLLVVDKESDGSRSDHPKGASTAMG